jgi:fatty acid synthase subunit alpha
VTYLSVDSYMQYHIDNCDVEKGETYKLAKELGQQLLDNCREALKENPLYKDGELRMIRCRN